MAKGGYDENIELDDLIHDRNDDDDDDDDILTTKLLTSTHQGARPKTKISYHSFENPSFEIDDIPTVDKRPTTLSEREENQDSAWERIKRKFPNFKSKKSKFTARVDEYDRVKVRLARRGSKEHNFFDNDGELNSDLPPTFKKNLGPSSEKIIEKIDRNNERWGEKNSEDEEQLKRLDISEEERKIITDRVNMRNERITDGVQEKGIIQERILLKDRIKSIFKKHGFTVVSVVTAIGVVIGVIVSNLKIGLAKVTNGVGNGLKEIGKKLGALLPGMIGAIASFIFKTAGEAIGFLAKNAWLLIVAVVVYFVEEFKKKKQ